MSRKSSAEVDEELVAPATDADQHGFWDGPTLELDDLDELDAAFAEDVAGGTSGRERETLVYMGSVPRTQVDDQELAALVAWAESKACPMCRDASRERDNPPPLDHEGCRQALRVRSLLRRYS